MKSVKVFVLTAILTLSLLSTGISAQDEPLSESGLTEKERSEVVSRILRWYFAPASKPRIVPLLAEGVDSKWLPKITNVEFRLIAIHEAVDFENDVYILKQPKFENGQYSIDFGSGDPGCRASGNTWAFRVSNNRVRLWPTNQGWGNGYGGSRIPPKIEGLPVGAVSPNELQGYEFFANGKLRNIRLGVSKREDIMAIFGSDCGGPCDYDENWSVWVNYFIKDNCGSVSTGTEKTIYCPKDDFIGTLAFVRLTPKKPISFEQVKFPRRFYRGESYAIGDSFSTAGFEGAVHSTIIHYTDSYGLKYEIFEKETFRNIPGELTSKKGDLVGIEYKIPNDFESGIYDATREPANNKSLQKK